jgi:hypothetical protein
MRSGEEDEAGAVMAVEVGEADEDGVADGAGVVMAVTEEAGVVEEDDGDKDSAT